VRVAVLGDRYTLTSELGRGAAIARALARDPSRRLATAEAFASALSDYTSRAGEGTRLVEDDRSIAVLPFANVSADADNEFFSDGLTDEIITDLSGVRHLRLVSRNSSMRLKGSTKTLPEIGRDLGVRYLLTGTVRKAGTALPHHRAARRRQHRSPSRRNGARAGDGSRQPHHSLGTREHVRPHRPGC
jgi:hypothetical protein